MCRHRYRTAQLKDPPLLCSKTTKSPLEEVQDTPARCNILAHTQLHECTVYLHRYTSKPIVVPQVGRDESSLPHGLKSNPLNIPEKEEASCYLSSRPRVTPYAHHYGGSAHSRHEYTGIASAIRHGWVLMKMKLIHVFLKQVHWGKKNIPQAKLPHTFQWVVLKVGLVQSETRMRVWRGFIIMLVRYLGRK